MYLSIHSSIHWLTSVVSKLIHVIVCSFELLFGLENTKKEIYWTRSGSQFVFLYALCQSIYFINSKAADATSLVCTSDHARARMLSTQTKDALMACSVTIIALTEAG